MLAHWRDVCSDLSVLHRIRDPLAEPGLDAPLLFAYAHRLDAYDGVIALRAARYRAQASAPRPGPVGEPMGFDEYFAGRRTQLIEAAARMGGGSDA